MNQDEVICIHHRATLYELVREDPRSYFRTRRVRLCGIEVNDRVVELFV